MEFTTTEEAVEVIPGRTVTTRVVFDRVAGEFRKGDGAVFLRFDSASPSPEAPAAGGDAIADAIERLRGPYLSMVGNAVEGTWEESGKVVRLEGLEDLRAAMTKGRAADDPARKVLEQLVNPFTLSLLLRPHLVVGERSISVGDEKAFQDLDVLPPTVGGPGLTYAKGKYLLKEVVDGVARVEMEAQVSLDPHPGMPPWPPSAAAFRNRLRLEGGSCRGWARIETATGRLLEDEHVSELDLRFLPPDGSAEVRIPAKQTRRLKLLK